jgi:ABC-type branched-subunit amino acid transport system ATPase component
MLKAEKVSKDFYGLRAVDQVSLEIEAGELVGLIGPNGSGKSTLFNCLTGFLSLSGGRIYFNGEDITGLPPNRIALRIADVQQIHVFKGLTAVENLMLASQQHQGERILSSFFNTPAILALEQESRESALHWLAFADMTRVKDEKAGNLSYGQQKILSFLTTLMPEPSVILLDEPAAAVNPTLVAKIMQHIRDLNRKGLTFLIIEHNMDVIMEL